MPATRRGAGIIGISSWIRSAYNGWGLAVSDEGSASEKGCLTLRAQPLIYAGFPLGARSQLGICSPSFHEFSPPYGPGRYWRHGRGPNRHFTSRADAASGRQSDPAAQRSHRAFHRGAVRGGEHSQQGEAAGEHAHAGRQAVLGAGGGGRHPQSLQDGQHLQRPYLRRARRRRREGDRGGAIEGEDHRGASQWCHQAEGKPHPQGDLGQAGRHARRILASSRTARR
ncbi:hypothetical protein CfE428DRAFT_4706 [Chthoniobacter flavus Ellin428]|uniref:Uncharacterized protein n=1 Tax=Chthoniobacter flavus Ellin428 TaxID=497964 RepID=B4D716_9BACT|nr:hypothetical protein CfE428DRAFT_4706 [Chthoniobacter flavus Ellin428]